VNGSTGHFLAGTDNTYDIGASAATRPRTVYAGTGFTGASIFTGTLNGVFGSIGSGPSIRFSSSNIVLHNNDSTQNDFNRLQFGGTTSSFPALKRTGTAINVRLADDSADAGLTAATLALAQGSIAADAQVLSATSTWNNVATTFTAIKMNATDTASAAGSLLMDLQVGGTSKFKVVKNGRTTGGSFELDEGYISGFSTNAGAMARTFTLRTLLIDSTPAITLNSSGSFGFTASAGGTDVGTSADTVLRRDAANTLAQRNSTNAQAFRVYNTFTDASNYERGKFEWASNVLRIGTEKAGTGTARALELQTDGTTWLTIGTNGVATFASTTLINGDTLLAQWIGFGGSGAPYGWIKGQSNGVIGLYNSATTDFGRLQFGGTTSSFPSLKRSSATLQVRLADDSAFAPVQGKLTTDTAYTAGDPVTTGYLTLYDSNGTAYKVPAVAV
jgi:hypothetical protein